MKIILQNESSECGLACLAMILSNYGNLQELSELRRKFSVSLKGSTLSQIMKYAGALGLASRPVRLETEELEDLRLPCILHWDMNHFVVLHKIYRKLNGRVVVCIIDPARGERKLSLEDVSNSFTGVALELRPNERFKVKEESKKIKILELTGTIIGIRKAILQILILALVLEVFAVILPLFNQFVVDEVIVSADSELLKVLIVGFSLLLITQATISLARSWLLMRWSIDIGLQWSIRVFSHLIRLPVSFFEKRHLGDVVSRFGSISSIQGTLTSLFVESFLDGLMALLALGMMFLYSPKLSFITILSVVFYGLIRLLFYQPFRDASSERLVLASKENSHFLETIKAITPLKLFGREDERISNWHNLKQDVINRDIKTQKLSLLFKIINTVISGIQGLALFYIGASLVISQFMTIGMLIAFTSYASTFTSRIFNIIDLFMNLRMLGLHTERLADIVLETPESDISMDINLDKIEPSITLKNVKFRYAEGEPWVLDGINLHIPAGQSIALVGQSGSGKTTLCKILLGLLLPTEGEILIDNIPVGKIGLKKYREIVGTVMQDDVLLTGSIFDNISFFDFLNDVNSVESCARIAAVHEEIKRMPMGYQSLVGDMGSGLSGGQKQRILLARALYKNPKILALDEATSHLDIRNEENVSSALAGLKLTRIIIAHRVETIRTAQRVVEITQGRIVEVGHVNFPKFSDSQPT